PDVASVPLTAGAVDVPGAPIPLTVPGHTSGNTIFHFAAEGVVVVGDALVTGHRASRRRGPQLLPSMFHHDEATARESLRVLAEVDAEILLPGHGPSWSGSPARAVEQALTLRGESPR